MVFQVLAAAIAPLFKLGALSAGSGRSNGWGNNISWHTLEQGYAQAKSSKKPMMVICHRYTCPACISFKHEISNSQNIEHLSRHFVMVNLPLAETPQQDRRFAPDGHYVPRVLFFTPEGHLMSHIKGLNDEYKYNYPNEHVLARSMNRVIMQSK